MLLDRSRDLILMKSPGTMKSFLRSTYQLVRRVLHASNNSFATKNKILNFPRSLNRGTIRNIAKIP